eukprot:6059344-Ditylum_brightwellii.AAC.1
MDWHGQKSLVMEWMKIIGWGRWQWNSLRKKPKQDLTAPIHGAVGKQSNNSKYWMEHDIMMCTFFNKIEALSSPRATQIVCVVSREGDNEELDIHDGDEELTELPSHVTKHCLYKNFVAEHGWKYYSRSKGKVSLAGMEGEQQSKDKAPVIWKETERRQETEEDDDGEELDSNKEEEPPQKMEDKERDAQMFASEKLILDAAKHMEMAQEQQNYVNAKKAEAVAT